MAFLDNSGDIILDAVLTDTGRFRLAKGDGSFKIVKFALGDDEINYGSYDKNNASGSAYYDLEILQTPVLEAFTNNTSTMKTKLVSIPRTNLLYLPVLKLGGTTENQTYPSNFGGIFVVAVDLATAGDDSNTGVLDGHPTQASTDSATGASNIGWLNGYNPSSTVGSWIRIGQGLDTTEIPPRFTLDADLVETQYIVEMDNRFGTLVSPGVNGVRANVSFIDDDNIASYYLSRTTDGSFITNLAADDGNSKIQGPRGTKLEFTIQASTDLATSTYLFEQLGNTGFSVVVSNQTMNDSAGGATTFALRYIDSIIKVTGATTGYSINIPVRYAKKIPT